MTYFYTHLETPAGREPAFAALDFDDLESAYLDACASLPSLSKELLHRGVDPARCALTICDADDVELLQVGFSDIVKVTPNFADRPRTMFNMTASLAEQLMETDRRAKAAKQELTVTIAKSRALLEESRRLLIDAQRVWK